jgi:hypothetical protein
MISGAVPGTAWSRDQAALGKQQDTKNGRLHDARRPAAGRSEREAMVAVRGVYTAPCGAVD